jgi:hypothetical protein
MMIQEDSNQVAALAHWARYLERRRDLLLDIQKRLEALERAGVVVEGEKLLLPSLQSQLEKASTILSDLEKPQLTETTSAHLKGIQHSLMTMEWELAEQVHSDLCQKDQERQRKLGEYEDQAAVWRTHARNLGELIERARRAKAPIVLEENEVIRIQGLFEQAERGLRTQHLGLLEDSLGQLLSDPGAPERLASQIDNKVKSTGHFARQADLLLLRSPLVEGRYQYDVLLRTPSEPGSHGINIQDSSTVVEQDHDLMKKTVEDVTGQINAGLAREFATRKSGEAGASSVGSVAATADASVRHLIPIGRDTEVIPPKNANEIARELGDLMYRLFMPEQMQRYLVETPCSLTITTNDLELPWELMWCDWSEHKFLCLDRPVARMPMGRAFPRRQTPVVRSRENKLKFLLIYADPDENLPEAGKEIERIKEGLELGWKNKIVIDVLQRDEAKGQRLNDILRNGTHDLIHYAGHGAFKEKEPDLSGLLLHKREVFFAQKVRRLLGGRPLVYLNTCESGRTANEKEPQKVGRFLQQPAEGLASSFIYGGALGCIGALWPVYDRPAADFAVEFYNLVLEGHMIGEAMRVARSKIRDKYPNQITWASFVLYGDPTYRLVG